MSASLVGSEMCIRDSPSIAQKVERVLAAATAQLPAGDAEFEPPQEARTPVSYTHLTLPTICSV
eukprot:14419637-Alexandrium_andersonii.AAC.1